MKKIPRRLSSTAFALSLAIVQVFAVSIEAKPRVEFTSPCKCEGNHGVSRWGAKTDLAEPPPNNIKPITPSQIYEWKGPGGKIPTRGERLPSEKHWYAVTGRVQRVKVEDDGDIHIEMSELDGKGGWIVVEVPLGPRWCQMRTTVFSWTSARFPIYPGREETIRLHDHPVVTVVGQAFYDIDHSSGDTGSNRRNYNQAIAVWEIHPVMNMAVGTANPPPAAVAEAPMPTISAPPTAATPIPQPSATSEQFITLTKPVTIQVPYGTTVLQPGTKLPVLSRDSQSVDVRYMNARYAIPIGSTDSQ